MMQEIDLTSWKRATHYQVFRNSAQPQYCVSFELDITNFLTKIRERGYSFTFAFVYAVSKCANEIEEFRYRFHEGKPVIYEKINTSLHIWSRRRNCSKWSTLKCRIQWKHMSPWQNASRRIRACTSQGRWLMISFSSRLFPGYLLPIFLIRIPAIGIKRRRYLTGESSTSGQGRSCCLFLSRFITLLSTVSTSANCRSICKNTWMNLRRIARNCGNIRKSCV